MTIVIAVVVALLIRFFLIEAYRIPTSAMRPTLEPGDTIFVLKWPYSAGFIDRVPERGEVILFTPRTDSTRNYIKRILGLPGELVEIKKGKVSIDGKTYPIEMAGQASCGLERISGLSEHGVCLEPPLIESFGPEKVPPSSVFVVGDLRSQRPEENPRSKSWGMFPLNSIRGRALWVWLSIEPQTIGMSPSWFPRFRFERMFRRIE